MNRIVLGALSALLFVSAGLFWLQGRAQVEQGELPPAVEAPDAAAVDPEEIPIADLEGMVGPVPPEATELSREQRRFRTYDRDHDGRITRNEMLSRRTSAFRRLDVDGNNLLTFEEWAVTTVDKFGKADADGNLELSRSEFSKTRPKKPSKRKCRC
ncbi:MAG: EF-hand domain-containing protein [Sphingomonadaceae bacterium]|nr:EF-hand domain-containing protein [Sphingomonadaceae bacterium]